ncbi:CG17199 [Drosophila busckii]|uniref:CG17199 n=1 Tax=Drosophila busckii TaxID=30019 RepID=A0A0M4F4Y4_DROBS|nr:uncharacterized oxidoreductase YjmC [Drosophila busckii]ALC46887.1 CG17199 [Drosophila busckii]
MRRIIKFLNKLRKFRPKLGSQQQFEEPCRTSAQQFKKRSLNVSCTKPGDNTRKRTQCSEQLETDWKKSNCQLEKPCEEEEEKAEAEAGNEAVWPILKKVLLMCAGQQKPLYSQADNIEGSLVDVLEVQRFVSDVFMALEVPPKAASEMSDVLIAADYMGQRHMGIHRLPAIAADLLNLTVDPRMQPKIICERKALALVDGQNAPGPVVANFCMDLAMRKARDEAIGFVAARHSNNIGMASWYACQALAQRLIGLCMTNAPPVLVPSGGIEPLLGGNPISFAASSTCEQFLVDLGMGAQTIEQLELDYCNGHLTELPSAQLALDCQGVPTTCAAEALRAQRLHAFQPEYKGFGLAAMVDVLCGVLTGASYATQLRRRGIYSTHSQSADLGQIFVAIDPMHFSARFDERLADFHQLLRQGSSCNAPLVPGDQEMLHMQQVDNQGGLIISPCTLSVLQELGDSFNIDALCVKTCDKQ